MENNELIKIWNTLSDNKLISEELAKDSIATIIKKKHSKVVDRIRKKVIFDFSLYLIAAIGVPIAWVIAYVNAPNPFGLIHLVGVLCVEAYLLYMFLKAYTKLRNLNMANYNLSAKSAIEDLKIKYLNILNNERIAAHILSYGLILVASIQYIAYIGGFQQASRNVLIFIGVLILIIPFILNYEYKIRYANSIKRLDKNIAELDE